MTTTNPTPKGNNNNNNNKNNDPCYHSFRLFAYLSVTVLSISIMVGFFLIFQHMTENDVVLKTFANQKTLIENQNYLKNITNTLHEHELKEISELEKRTEISLNNSKKLDQILKSLR